MGFGKGSVSPSFPSRPNFHAKWYLERDAGFMGSVLLLSQLLSEDEPGPPSHYVDGYALRFAPTALLIPERRYEISVSPHVDGYKRGGN
jgi:hypothetical protein